MFKQTAAVVLACSALAVAGCSSDDDDDTNPVDSTVDTGTTDPGTTDPGTTDPGTTDPGTTTTTAGTFDVSITNNSIGQPMTPPVVAIHDPSVSFFEIGDEVSPELRSIAEDGSNDLMVALVEATPEVSASGLAFVDAENPGPLMPGETATITLETDDDSNVLTIVNMVICTNDGFTGVNSVALPTGTDTGTDTVTFEAVPYDAGSEINVIDLEYWVPPCGGSGANLHDDENGVIAIHPGQDDDGLAQFNFVGTETILTVEVTRTGTTEGVEEPVTETGTETGGGTVSENAGPAQAALESTGTFSTFLAAFDPIAYDENGWTVFAPTDASIPDGAAVNAQNHIAVNSGPLTPAELLAAGSITTNAGVTYAVTGTEDAILVDGNPVSFLVEGGAGAQIYTIEGVLGDTPSQ